MHRIRFAFLAILIPLFAEGPARIYVYAQRPSAARSWIPISCDNAMVARLRQGTFFAVNVAPGKHVLSTDSGVPTVVELRPGEDVFVRLDWHMEIGRRAIPALAAVKPERAQQEMTYLSYIDAGKVLAASVPKSDPRRIPEPQLKKRPQ
jgi:hypothetical protein